MNGNQNALARFLGVNKSTVSRAIKAGRIQPEPDGSFDFDRCAAAWHASAGGREDVAARHAHHRGAALPRGAAPEPGGMPPLGVDLDGAGRAKAKAMTLHYENSVMKIEMALRRGLRYEQAAVLRESVALGAMVRAGIERVIDQCAPRLAASGNDLERRRILDHEVRRLRWILKRELPRALRRMRQSGEG